MSIEMIIVHDTAVLIGVTLLLLSICIDEIPRVNEVARQS